MVDQISYTVGKVVICTFDLLTEAYTGSPTLMKAEGFQWGEEIATDERKNLGRMVRGLSVVEGFKPTLNKAFYTPAVLTILHGASVVSSKWRVKMGTNHPYWGIIIQLLTDLGGDLHVGFPMNLASTFPLGEVATNELSSKDFEWTAFAWEKADGTIWEPVLEEHAAKTDPPTVLANFSNFLIT